MRTSFFNHVSRKTNLLREENENQNRNQIKKREKNNNLAHT
jgi:hypothetical protein